MNNEKKYMPIDEAKRLADKFNKAAEKDPDNDYWYAVEKFPEDLALIKVIDENNDFRGYL